MEPCAILVKHEPTTWTLNPRGQSAFGRDACDPLYMFNDSLDTACNWESNSSGDIVVDPSLPKLQS